MAVPSQFERRRENALSNYEVLPEDVEAIEIVDENFDEYDQYAEDTLDMPLEGGVPVEHDSNLADTIEEGSLDALSSELRLSFDKDKESISDWQQIASQGIDLLGFKIEDRTEPFDGACGISHPLLSQAVVKFQAKAYKELLPPGGPVKTQIVGPGNEKKEAQALRVRRYMNYQITQEMTEFADELDRLLFYLGLYGTAFKKIYYDEVLRRPTSLMVRAEDLVVNYNAKDLDSCGRYTHVVQMSGNDLLKAQAAGIYRDVELGEPSTPEVSDMQERIDELHGRSPGIDSDEVYTILEMYMDLMLEEDPQEVNFAVPYIVTIEQESGKVLALRRNWKEGDDTYKRQTYFVTYTMIPGLGFYGYGYLHLIGGMGKSATSILRQLVDAGTFANLPAGFKSHALRMLSSDEPLSPGEWRDASIPSGKVSDAFMPLPYKEPSPTLFNLLQFIVEAGREFADATDQVISEATNYGPVGTTMALIEQSTKLYSAIHKRLHRSQSRELRLLAAINHDYLPEEHMYDVGGQSQLVYREDFNLASIDVVPVSDPNIPTEAHRIAKLNAVMSIAGQNPAMYNMKNIASDMFSAMGIEEYERYFASKQEPYSGDPVSENAAALQGVPLKVEPHQHHDAHIAVHASILQNPAYAQAGQMKAIMLDHFNAHLAAKSRTEMLQMMGDPAMEQAVMKGEKLPPEMENAIAMRAAEIADKVMELDTVKAQILAGQSADPTIKLQEREQDLREQEVRLGNMIERAKVQQAEVKMIIEDENADADRAQQLVIERMRLSGRKNTRGEGKSPSK